VLRAALAACPHPRDMVDAMAFAEPLTRIFDALPKVLDDACDLSDIDFDSRMCERHREPFALAMASASAKVPT
jgi:hypothetical protein